MLALVSPSCHREPRYRAVRVVPGASGRTAYLDVAHMGGVLAASVQPETARVCVPLPASAFPRNLHQSQGLADLPAAGAGFAAAGAALALGASAVLDRNALMPLLSL